MKKAAEGAVKRQQVIAAAGMYPAATCVVAVRRLPEIMRGKSAGEEGWRTPGVGMPSVRSTEPAPAREAPPSFTPSACRKEGR